MPNDTRTSRDKSLTVTHQPTGAWRFAWVDASPKKAGSIELMRATGGRWNFVAVNNAGRPLRMYDSTGWATFDAALEAAAEWFAVFRETIRTEGKPHADA